MGSLMQVDRKQWEEFIRNLSELEEKYRLVLDELDTAYNRLEALGISQMRYGEGSTLTMSASGQGSVQSTTRDEKTRRLTAPPSRRLLRPIAFCDRCDARVTHASRFCERCGADFGKWVCSCGLELADSDRFCYRCGRSVEALS